MPLWPDEQARLDELAARTLADDPGFVSGLGSGNPCPPLEYRRRSAARLGFALAAAALALGASYDPVVLSRLGVRGVDADVGKARAWYQKAKEFGAPDADRRLSTLANR